MVGLPHQASVTLTQQQNHQKTRLAGCASWLRMRTLPVTTPGLKPLYFLG
jgi:hypothetical protein